MSAPIPLNRRKSRRDSPDFFPTPPWATRALCGFLAAQGLDLAGATVWEPACGDGDMARPLKEYFRSVTATDIRDSRERYPEQSGVADFLLSDQWVPQATPGAFDWIITNPPFILGGDFAERAIERAAVGCALFVKQQFLEGLTRYDRIYSRRWPSWILQFAERVPLVENHLDPEADTNQAYIWIVWLNDRFLRHQVSGGMPGARFHWIAPCRARLERVSDYPAPPPPPDTSADTPLFRAADGAQPEES